MRAETVKAAASSSLVCLLGMAVMSPARPGTLAQLDDIRVETVDGLADTFQCVDNLFEAVLRWSG